jgi:uncharacterized protein involved in exopolysaccharide biosynthesis
VKTGAPQKSLGEKISSALRSRSTPRTAFFVVSASVFLLLFGLTVLATFILPKVYSSSTRVRTELVSPASGGHSARLNPSFVAGEIELIQSETFLGKVGAQLNLLDAWSKEFGGGRQLTQEEFLEMFRQRIQVRSRGDSTIGISVFSESPAEAAQIANAIAEEYRRYSLEQTPAPGPAKAPESKGGPDAGLTNATHRVEILEVAVPNPEPVRPRVKANLAAGFLGGAFLGVTAGGASAGVVYLIGRTLRRRHRW